MRRAFFLHTPYKALRAHHLLLKERNAIKLALQIIWICTSFHKHFSSLDCLLFILELSQIKSRQSNSEPYLSNWNNPFFFTIFFIIGTTYYYDDITQQSSTEMPRPYQNRTKNRRYLSRSRVRLPHDKQATDGITTNLQRR